MSRKESAYKDLIREIGLENANDAKTLKIYISWINADSLQNLRDTKEKLKKTLLDLKNAVHEKDTIIYVQLEDLHSNSLGSWTKTQAKGPWSRP